jgi:hypothetical protein
MLDKRTAVLRNFPRKAGLAQSRDLLFVLRLPVGHREANNLLSGADSAHYSMRVLMFCALSSIAKMARLRKMVTAKFFSK